MLRFQCAVCHKKLAGDDEQAGEPIRCAGCGATLIAPEAGLSPTPTLPVAIEAPIHLRTTLSEESEDMDMTPMVDVTFLLLIFFMVTASYALQKSFEMPRTENQRSNRAVQSVQSLDDNPDYIIVRVDAFNTFFVSSAATSGGEEVEVTDRQSLLVELRRIRDAVPAAQAPSRLVVMAHGDARHEQVVLAMDAGNDIGMDDVWLLTTEDEDV